MRSATLPTPKAHQTLAARRRQDWLSPDVVTGTVRMADLLALGASALLAHHAVAKLPVPAAWFGIALAGLIVAQLGSALGAYRFASLERLPNQVARSIAAWAASLLILLALAAVTGTVAAFPPAFLLSWSALGLGGLVLIRLVARRLLRTWHESGRLRRNLVIVGAGPQATRLIQHVHSSEPTVRIIGLFDDRRTRVPEYIAGFPVLGTIDELIPFVRTRPIDQVVLALPREAERRLLDCLKRLRHLPVDVRLCPDLVDFHIGHRGVTELAGLPLLNVFDRPLQGWSYIAKTIEDRLLALLILVFTAPLLLFLALLVRLDSPGPVLYRQKRYGFNNEVIEVFKFRTMYADRCDGDEGEVVQAARDDPRVTRLGRCLRRTSLDELPQFLNVLRGEMSIVGPRPHAVVHNEQYAGLIDDYLARHRVKPGITGWAQVNGHRGGTETLEKMQERVRHDLHYIENWSLCLDLHIILRTLFVGFSHPNAY